MSVTPGLSPGCYQPVNSYLKLQLNSHFGQVSVFDHLYANVSIMCFLMSVQWCLEWAVLP